MRLKKRIAALLMAGAMVCSTLPVSAWAVERTDTGGLCEHHPEHTAECGYTEGTPGTPCGHEHTGDCYTLVTECVHEHGPECYPAESVSENMATPSEPKEPTACTHVCDEESGCVTEKLDCPHEHDGECGYTPATEGTPCTFVCEICNHKDSDQQAEDETQPGGDECICTEPCAVDNINEDCPVCGVEGADLTLCEGVEQETATPSNGEKISVEDVQAMIDALPSLEDLEAMSQEEQRAAYDQVQAAYDAYEALTDEEKAGITGADIFESLFALFNGTATLLDATSPTEQFENLDVDDTYWFDLSGEGIPGTVNTGNNSGAVSVPDTTLHWVPFTYAGTINAYSRDSEVSIDENVSPYDHSLFIADYAVTHTVSWDELNTKNMIFGANYQSGGVDYTLRTPSVGSSWTGSGEDERGTPESNEWDMILNKDGGYIKNYSGMFSWGQDTYSSDASYRANRGYNSARLWNYYTASTSISDLGFRPVLEILDAGTLGSDGLEVVTVNLNGGKIGSAADDVHIVVKFGAGFTAPSGDGLTRPDGNTDTYFAWLGSDGKTYAPGAIVPTGVTELTAQWEKAPVEEQFDLTPGGTYWFDLSGAGIPGTVNTGNERGAVSVPDTTLHWVPFTYAGTINAYVLNSSSSGQTGASQAAASATDSTGQYGYTYDHSLFIADYNLTHTVSWDDLNAANKNMIFGANYQSGGVGYTLRAPSAGSSWTGSGESMHGTPGNNEWDAILNKNGDYIKNWGGMYSWGQDTYADTTQCRAIRGYSSARYYGWSASSYRGANYGFRPVLEILNVSTLGSDGLEVVTVNLNGGKVGMTATAVEGPVNLVVKSGASFTAPSGDGLTRPDGNTDTYFAWLGSDGKTYAPGETVPASVTELTAQWEKAPVEEQFDLTPGGTYWFDLSGVNIPGTVNTGNKYGAVSVPDVTLTWVPFTYAGTINAYVLNSASSGQVGASQVAANATDSTGQYGYTYDHSLFIADYAVTHTVTWNNLNDINKNMIFGTNYISGGVNYTLRAPSMGNYYSLGSGSITPESNEWDAILDKNTNYIKNWNGIYSWGQDTHSKTVGSRSIRGCNSAQHYGYDTTNYLLSRTGFRPVLEILDAGTLGSDGLEVVTVNLNGGKVGTTDTAVAGPVNLVVKSGAGFTAPSGDGLTRPDGNTDTYFAWLGSDGNTYAPGAPVPANVAELTAQWKQTPPTSSEGYTINYAAETITAKSGYELATESTAQTGSASLNLTPGTNVYVRKAGSDTLAPSAWTEVTIPARPGKPSGLQGQNTSFAGETDGKITGLNGTASYQISGDGGTTWTGPAVNNGEITGLAAGVYQVRLAAVANTSFASEAATVDVGSGGQRTYTLNVTAPAFNPVTSGYAQPEAKAITITSTGNSDATISSVTVSDTGKFTIGGSGSTVTAGGSITTWTVRPAAGLGVGTHTATITVTYNGGAMATATVSFTVNSSGGTNPGEGGTDKPDSPGGSGSSSSSGGSSSSDSGSSVTTRPDQNNPDTPTTGQTAPVKPGTDGSASIPGSAVQDAISKATADAKKNGNTANGIAVTVPIQNAADAQGLTITISAETLDKLVAAQVRRFDITTNGLSSFGFTLDTLKMLDTQSQGGDLILRMVKTTVASNEAKEAIGTRPAYDISLVYVKNGVETPLTDWQGKTISVKLPYTPAANGQTGNLYAVYVDGNGKVDWLAKSSYDPDQKAVLFEAEHFSIYGVGYKAPVPAFTDISGHWAEQHILFAAGRGLLYGTVSDTGDYRFSPDSGITRGMFVTALGRLSGIDPADYRTGKFTDVPEDAWYASYVNWAAQSGLLDGIAAAVYSGSAIFSPDSSITRQEMAVIMKNYAAKMGCTLPKTLVAVTFTDNGQISSWAADAVRATQQAGILIGKDGACFDPQGIATRAEAAAVLHRFVEVVIDPQTANGWVQNDSGKWYYFYQNGTMAANTIIEGYTIGPDGAAK